MQGNNSYHNYVSTFKIDGGETSGTDRAGHEYFNGKNAVVKSVFTFIDRGGSRYYNGIKTELQYKTLYKPALF